MAVLNQKSKERLATVEPALASVIEACVAKFPKAMSITEGIRTIEQQRQYVKEGKSKTMNSYHIPRPGRKYARAVDVAIFKDDGTYSGDMADYKEFAVLVLKEAAKRGLKIRWGGNWTTFPDGPHFQIEQ